MPKIGPVVLEKKMLTGDAREWRQSIAKGHLSYSGDLKKNIYNTGADSGKSKNKICIQIDKFKLKIFVVFLAFKNRFEVCFTMLVINKYFINLTVCADKVKILRINTETVRPKIDCIFECLEL